MLHGPKRAAASLVESNEATPVANGYSVITEFDGAPRAAIRTTSLETRALSAVDAQFASHEGDRTLADWLDGHRRDFARECARLGRTYGDDAPVALQRFELLYPFNRALATRDGPASCPAVCQVRSARSRRGTPATKARRTASARILRRRSRARQLAHLRWFVLDARLRGRGLGKRLLGAAMQFCRCAGFRLVYLNTFAGLDPARVQYKRAGFRLVDAVEGETWGRTMLERRFEWTP